MIVCELPWFDAVELVAAFEFDPDVELAVVVVVVVLIGFDVEFEFEPAEEPETDPETVVVVCTGFDVAFDAEFEPETAPASDPDTDVLVCANAGVILPATSAKMLMAVQSLFMTSLLTGPRALGITGHLLRKQARQKATGTCRVGPTTASTCPPMLD
ncbi:MAG TPA: hypothetical protein VN222_02285 [Novosphingobium sp.]|nr:hypothetical protein [Novosphingobium sp.]